MGDLLLNVLPVLIPIQIGSAAVLLAVYVRERRRAGEAGRRMIGNLQLFIDRSQL